MISVYLLLDFYCLKILFYRYILLFAYSTNHTN